MSFLKQLGRCATNDLLCIFNSVGVKFLQIIGHSPDETHYTNLA
jgi:hypothetical protein